MPLFEDPGIDEFHGLNLRQLTIDQAYLVVTSGIEDQTRWLYARSDDCHQCAFSLLGLVNGQSNTSHVIGTKHGWTLRFLKENVSQLASTNTPYLCELHGSFGEFGVYDVTIDQQSNCTLSTLKEPVDIYIPLLACFIFYVVLAILWILGNLAYRKKWFHPIVKLFGKTRSETSGDQQLPTSNKDAKDDTKKKQRLKSIDVFRGMSIVIMIFVNDGGGQYYFFEHATWNGLYVADLVFPWFLWIMGACIPISLRSSLKRKESRLSIVVNILRRSCILFLLGLILNTLGGYVNLDRIRIPGVLQRFAISYFVAASVAAVLLPSDLSAGQTSSKWRAMFQDVIVLLPQWIVMLLLVATHCLITFLMQIEGCPRGYLGPGGLHMDARFSKECIGGAAGYIDRWFFGTNHIYNWPTARAVYDSAPYDPEGMLGSYMSVFQVFLGVQAGTTLLVYQKWFSRVKRWIVWTIITGVIGAILCKGSQNDGWIPINKNLWSLSFVLVTSCFAFFLLSLCYILVDVKKFWNGAPFFYPGMNSILLYVGHNVAYNLFPWHWISGEMNSHWERLVENLWGTTLWVVIATWLYYKKFFLTI